jgi:hypothetical protein
MVGLLLSCDSVIKIRSFIFYLKEKKYYLTKFPFLVSSLVSLYFRVLNESINPLLGADFVDTENIKSTVSIPKSILNSA